jgi:hypothetical protein
LLDSLYRLNSLLKKGSYQGIASAVPQPKQNQSRLSGTEARERFCRKQAQKKRLLEAAF